MAVYDTLLGYFIRRNIIGKNRIYNFMVRGGLRKLIIVQAKYGIKLYLNPHEYIDEFIINEGFYESEVTEEILEVIKEGDCFWDIGANIGIHSIAVKKNLPNTKVYSFEPNPKTLGLLYENIKLNNLDIQVCGFALFDKVSSMTLHLADGNSGMSTLAPWQEMKVSSTTKCLTVTGDKLISEGFTLPTLIKIDTEGTELNILRGCQSILSTPVLKTIIFEGNNNLLEKLDKDETTIFLKDFGFTQIKQLSRFEKTQHGLSNFVATKPKLNF